MIHLHTLLDLALLALQMCNCHHLLYSFHFLLFILYNLARFSTINTRFWALPQKWGAPFVVHVVCYKFIIDSIFKVIIKFLYDANKNLSKDMIMFLAFTSTSEKKTGLQAPWLCRRGPTSRCPFAYCTLELMENDKNVGNSLSHLHGSFAIFYVRKLVVCQVEAFVFLQHLEIHVGDFIEFVHNVPKIHGCHRKFDFELPNLEVPCKLNFLAITWLRSPTH